MSSGGSQSTTTSSLPSWMNDAAQSYLGAASQVAQQPYQGYTGQRVADLSPTTLAGIQGTRDLAYGSPIGNAANKQVMDTLAGNFSNPYQQGVADRITGDATKAFFGANNALLGRMKGPNRNSSSFDQQQAMLEQNFARGLTDGLAPVYQSGYENERNRQVGAVGQAQGLLGTFSQQLKDAINAGMVETGQQQRLIDSAYGDFNEQRNYPAQQLAQFGNALGSLTGAAPRTQTTQGPGADPVSSGLGLFTLGNALKSK